MERRKMQKKKKRIFAVLLSAILVVALTGCSKLGSIINEIHGSLIGNNYTVYTYDNYGNQTLKTSGKKISITGNKIETVSYDSDGSDAWYDGDGNGSYDGGGNDGWYDGDGSGGYDYYNDPYDYFRDYYDVQEPGGNQFM